RGGAGGGVGRTGHAGRPAEGWRATGLGAADPPQLSRQRGNALILGSDDDPPPDGPGGATPGSPEATARSISAFPHYRAGGNLSGVADQPARLTAERAAVVRALSAAGGVSTPAALA